MSWTLFKTNLKNNRFIWALMTGIYLMYVLIMVSMFDPQDVDALNEMMSMMPKEMIDAMGFTFGTTLLTFMSGSLYGVLLYAIPLIAVVVINNRLVASMVDKGSMAYLLATPNSRIKLALTQAVFSLCVPVAMFTVVTSITVVSAQRMFPGALEIGKFVLLNANAVLLYFAVGGICFFASCLFNDSSKSLGVGAGLPLAFVLLQMLGNAGGDIEWMGNLSLYHLFNPDKLFAGDSFAFIGMAVYATLAAVLYIGGIVVFDKKDMPV